MRVEVHSPHFQVGGVMRQDGTDGRGDMGHSAAGSRLTSADCWIVVDWCWLTLRTASLSHKVLFSPCSCLGTRPSLSKPDHSKFRKIEKGNPLTAPRREEQFADSIMASISQVARRTSNSTASARGNGPDWGQHIQLPWCHGSKCSPQAQLKTLEKKETCFYVHIRS